MGVEVRVVDFEDRDVSVGEIWRGPGARMECHEGILEASGPHQGRPARRLDAHRRQSENSLKEGFLYILDRKKDMIKAGR